MGAKTGIKMESLRLDLGGVGRGGQYTTVNLDSSFRSAPDVVADITASTRQLEKHFKFNTVSEIRCSHTLEHLPYTEAIESIKYWYRFLHKGGTLKIIVPDVETILSDWKSGSINTGQLIALMYANPNNVMANPLLESHKWAYTHLELVRALYSAGFKDVLVQGFYIQDNASVDLDEPPFWVYDYPYPRNQKPYKVPNLVARGTK